MKSGNLCSIRISQDVCDMFKSRDGTCQQRHLLRFVLWFPDSLQTLIRHELVEGLLLFLLFLCQHVRQMCQPRGDAVKSGNLCNIRIS